jgi:anti-anti-sigma factor
MQYATQVSCILSRMSAPEPLQFRTEEVAIGTTAMVSLHGELDIQYGSQVVAGFDRALDRGPSALAADLRGLTFMDSTGVHALLDAERRCHRQGARFFVIVGCEAVERVLCALGLDRLFEIIAGPEQIPGVAAVA